MINVEKCIYCNQQIRLISEIKDRTSEKNSNEITTKLEITKH